MYKMTCTIVRSVLPGDTLQPPASNQQETKVFSQAACREQNSANHHKWLETDPSFPSRATAEHSGPDDSLIAASHGT